MIRLNRVGTLARDWWRTVLRRHPAPIRRGALLPFLRNGHRRPVRMGLYGPPAAGKTTLANRIARDLSGAFVGTSTGIPHETRRVQGRANLLLTPPGGGRLSLNVVDTPGIATKVDYRDFMTFHGLPEADARARAREATEGVLDAIAWLDDVDAVVLVLDATLDPLVQANVTLLQNLEDRKRPVVIAANKIDLPGASPARVREVFPRHPVVPVSARSGYNVDRLYATLVERFR